MARPGPGAALLFQQRQVMNRIVYSTLAVASCAGAEAITSAAANDLNVVHVALD